MIGTLSRRERIVAAGGLGAALLIGGWMLVVQPILERNRAAAELIPAREQVLERRRGLIARKNVILEEVRATDAEIDKLSARFLTATTPAVAASELQKIAKDLAAQASTEIRSERILPTAERGELLEVPIEIAVSGDIRQFVDLLARLEGAPKLLTVQELKVRVVNVSQPRELLATLTLSGFILPGKVKT